MKHCGLYNPVATHFKEMQVSLNTYKEDLKPSKLSLKENQSVEVVVLAKIEEVAFNKLHAVNNISIITATYHIFNATNSNQ